MIRLTKLALQRPVTVILCLVTIAYFGFQSLIGARMELIPEMELPMLLISTIYAGAAPDDVEELITTKEEDALATLGSVDTIQSYSMENMSLIMVQYQYGYGVYRFEKGGGQCKEQSAGGRGRAQHY